MTLLFSLVLGGSLSTQSPTLIEPSPPIVVASQTQAPTPPVRGGPGNTQGSGTR
ncbi:hypothetical protein [Vacuolonema iberomarrocanum]|uniref:hypothetical protein n=1 Tax=Vacuolonema iberomarrocanum TaxID=3454632 RepID=UPI001A047402|nr:hypothetical protein [filamentous cyanobacterium LEGE 07170]